MTSSTSAEEWRVVAEFPAYEVSDHGRVRRIGTEEALRPLVGGNTPYMRLRLSGGKDVLIHRVVAKAFVPNPEGKPCVDHINGCKSDNRSANLRWATRRENQRNRRSKQPFKGMSYDSKSCKWFACIRTGFTNLYLGRYDTPEEAYHIYCAAAVLYHGDFASG